MSERVREAYETVDKGKVVGELWNALCWGAENVVRKFPGFVRSSF